MPLTVYRAQVALLMDSGIPADAVSNTFYFRDTTSHTADQACDFIVEQLARFYTHFDGVIFSKKLSGACTVRIYDMADAKPRIPKREDTSTITVTPLAGNALPPEVAICSSIAAEPESGINPQSLRGRVFLGPLDEAALDTNGMVASAAITSIVEAAEEMMVEAAADNLDWVVYSPTLDAGGESLLTAARAVVRGWVDNAPDTQRRRGVAASSRTSWPA